MGREFTVVAYIDARPAVHDYRVMGEETLDRHTEARLANALLASKFQPVSRVGQPVSGPRVLQYQ